MAKLLSSIDSELVETLARWVGNTAVGTAVLMLLAVIVVRVVSRSRARGARRKVAVWRPWLMDVAIVGLQHSSVPRPDVRRRDLVIFAREWNGLHESVSGRAALSLNAAARAIGLDCEARKWLDSRNPARRFLGLATLGHLRDQASWRRIKACLESPGALESMMAARALIQIDPENGTDVIAPLIASRNDWPAGRVASMLFHAGPELVAEPMVEALAALDGRPAIRVLRFIHVLPTPISESAIVRIMQRTDDPDLLSACLRALRSPQQLPAARALVGNASWPVRLNALAYLGRVGGQRDVKYLIRGLADPVWWVRYRCAKSLVALPWMNFEKLRYIQSRRTDRYAVDVLEQVIAEARL